MHFKRSIKLNISNTISITRLVTLRLNGSIPISAIGWKKLPKCYIDVKTG